MPFRDTKHIKIGLAHGRYCASCVNAIIQEHTRECVVCGTTYLAKEYNQSLIFCPPCNTDNNRHEYAVFSSNLVARSK